MKNKLGAVGAIIVAAGKGSRMGLGYNKILANVSGKSVIEWTLRSFVMSNLIEKIILVINPEDRDFITDIIKPYITQIDLTLVNGGKERQDSVYKGLNALGNNVELVLIHDGARPIVDEDLIKRSIMNARKYGAACAGMPVKETIKIVNNDNTILSTPERTSLWSAQTPQAFKMSIIIQAYEMAYQKRIMSTDDAGLAEAAGYKVKMFEGSYKNIKLTSLEDISVAEQLLKDRQSPL